MSNLQELEEKVRALELRIRATEDVDAIVNLKSRYGQLVDSRYSATGVKNEGELGTIARQVAELFTEDAVWDGGETLGVARGREEIYQRFLKPTLSFTWHYFVKPRIRVDGDRAQGTWDILAPCTTRDERPLWMAGYEEDQYTRVDGRWLHSRMKLSLIFMAPYERGWVRKGVGS